MHIQRKVKENKPKQFLKESPALINKFKFKKKKPFSEARKYI